VTADGGARSPRPWRGAFAGAAGAALGIAVLTALARVAGFGRTLVFARTVGATCLGDTYVTANTIPNIVFEIVAGGALASLVVPVLAGPVARGDRDQASRTASALLSWALLVAVPVTLAGLLVARPLVALLVGPASVGCTGHDEITVGARMLLVFMPQVVFYAVVVVVTGILQAHRRFLAPAVGPLVSSVVVIAAYLVFSAQHEALRHQTTDLAGLRLRSQLILSVGTTLGVVALALPLLVPMSRLGLRLRPTLRFPDTVGRRVVALAIAGAVTLAAQQVSVGVVVRLAHRGSGGSLVLYNLAWTVFLVPWAVLAVPIATTAFPRLVAAADHGEVQRYSATVALGVRVVVVVTAAAAAAVAGAAVPVARVLVLRVPGNGDTRALALTLLAFAPGLVGYGLVAYVGRALYARASWRAAAVAICAGWATVIVADVLLVGAFAVRWRVVALGLGNTIGMTAAGVLLVLGLRRASGATSLNGVGRTCAGAAVGAAVGFGLGSAVSGLLGHGGIGPSIAVALLSGCVGFAVCIALVLAIEPAANRSQLVDLMRRLPAGRLADADV
jgi:putative peptidoglycan lipid II flippase